MLLIENASAVYTMSGDQQNPLGAIPKGEVVVDGNTIHWVGKRKERPTEFNITQTIDAQGGCVLPGLIDCHTHIPFAGDRAEEFAMRARGATYAEIMQAGGGILNTMKAVRDTHADQLVQQATAVLDAMLARGVTTVEGKSGYGLSTASELKCLQVHQRLHDTHAVDVCATFLGAHALPPEYKDNIDDYVDLVTEEMLPAVKAQGIATACDIFIEKGAFTPRHGAQILGKAKDLGFQLKVHAEQLSHSGGAQLAAEMGALSVSHCEYVSDADLQLLADNQVVCEVLATAQVFLNSPQAIPGARMSDAGVCMAVGTDYNPGSANCADLHLAAGLAITQCGLTAEEALLGMTAHGAAALGLQDRGMLVSGLKADCVVLSSPTPFDLVYHWSHNPVSAVIKDGALTVEPRL